MEPKIPSCYRLREAISKVLDLEDLSEEARSILEKVIIEDDYARLMVHTRKKWDNKEYESDIKTIEEARIKELLDEEEIEFQKQLDDVSIHAKAVDKYIMKIKGREYSSEEEEEEGRRRGERCKNWLDY
ncbi:hypothetical protein ADUPG1_012241 [Aduncisulcus paluster]|uniref:Uncharacterized protein n=1 Tax=Aduncisulcus paluster TaxID=2918883 RepID=A0ABQ5K0Z3_9EUKA|nr:hypothetical protein ADUPG1_012241 [Aduncisulcus paluster]